MRWKKLDKTIIKTIRKRVKNGEYKKDVAKELGVSCSVVRKYTKDIPTILRISEELEQKIRDKVKTGKNKKEVAKELGVGYNTVKKYTIDMNKVSRIPVELKQQIREEVKKGKLKKQVAKELNVSYSAVRRYTRDIKYDLSRKRSPEQIKEIRANVRKYNSKLETARKMRLPHHIVRYYTIDIKIKRGLPPEIKEKIRKGIENGKTKRQIAKELNICYNYFVDLTKDIKHIPKKADISHRAFLLLKDTVNRGYALPSSKYGLNEYQILKKKFPNICRVKMYGRVIFFLKDKSDFALRAFLEITDRKIISYQELQQLIDVFHGHMKKKDKKKYLGKTN